MSEPIICPTCKFLKFQPRKEEKQHLKALKYEAFDETNSPREQLEYLQSMISWGGLRLSRWLRAWCGKLDQCCVLTESVVINEWQPLFITLANLDHLKDCPEREIDDPTERLITSWFLCYLDLD